LRNGLVQSTMNRAMQSSAPVSPAPQASSGAGWWLALGVMTLSAVILRLIALDRNSFWYDEAVSAQLCRATGWDLFFGVAKDDGNPPLYWILLRVWSLLWGNSEATLRSLSVIFGAAAVPMLASLGRSLFGRSAGLLAAFLLTVSPLAIELSNGVRAYALLHFLGIACTLLFCRWIEHPRLTSGLAYALSTAALCYCHYFGFFVPLAHGVALVAGRDQRRLLLPWLGAMAFAAALWMPWLPSFLSQLRTPGNLKRMEGGWVTQFMATPTAFVFGRSLVWRDSSKIALACASLAAIVLVWIPAAMGFFRSWRRESPQIAIGAWLVLPIALPLLVALTLTPLYHVRAASVSLPALLLLAAVGIASFPDSLRIAVIAGLLSVTAVSLGRYATVPLNDDWRSATPFVLSGLRSGEPILFDTMIEVASFKYYVPAGAMPSEMIGLQDAPSPDGSVIGVGFRNGNRVDAQRIDYRDRVFDSPGVWVLLCVPSGTPDQYKALFARRGFALTDVGRFTRIDVLHFQKVRP
jgi:mannosyltransferase